MDGDYYDSSLRHRLIVAGIEEIAQNGISHFSLRRVASSCGASCAAPYKHFKNKEEFILATVEYINDQWELLKNQILSLYENDKKQQLVEVAVAYIRFLVANSNYRAALGNSGHSFVSVTSRLNKIIDSYCEFENIDEVERKRKVYAVMAIIYGTVAMFDYGELSNDEEDFSLIRSAIEKEI